MKPVFKKVLDTLVAASLVLMFTGAQAVEPRNYILATASTGGTYYPVGVALATLTKVKIQPEHKTGMSAINSAGSGENVKLLRDDEAQFAILQGLFGSYAWNGTGPVKQAGKQTYLRSVSMLWQNVEHFVVANKFVKTGTVADLAGMDGQKMAMGKKNSGTIGSNRKILANLGIDMDTSYELMHAGYGPSAAALQDGRVAGVGIPAGAPAGAITKLLASAGSKVTPLQFTAELAEKGDGGLGLWTPYIIEAGTYPGQTKDWSTIAQPNFLATRADVDEEFVYRLTKTMYENLEFLHAIHKATKAMAIEKALDGLPVPLHKGAARYYKEVGIDISAHLIID